MSGEATGAAVHGYVMAGGASTRFGFDKARAELGGKNMLARTCELLEGSTASVSVVAPFGRYADFAVRLVDDPWPGEGPLGGIIAALMDAHARDHAHTWCLVVGCDMPFLTRDWLGYLVDRASSTHAAIVAPQSAQGLEPLCACWHTRATAKLQHAFEDGIRKVTEAMKRLDTEVVDEASWKRFDSHGRLFWNMNSLQDYENALKVFGQEAK